MLLPKTNVLDGIELANYDISVRDHLIGADGILVSKARVRMRHALDDSDGPHTRWITNGAPPLRNRLIASFAVTHHSSIPVAWISPLFVCLAVASGWLC